MEDFLLDLYASFAPESLIEDLYDEALLTPITLAIVFVIAPLAAVLFYYIINSIRFGQLRHWLLTMLIVGLIAFAITYFTCSNMANLEVLRNANNPNLGYRFDQGDGVFITFSAEMLLIACLFFFLWSIAIKWKSRNCRRTPF